jgi:phospholipid-binding lipoprotein MlaA
MRKILIALTVAALMAGCATTSGTANPRDPWEPFNRGVFKFNDNLDRDIVKPLIDTYTTLVPEFARTGISNFFSNVGDVWVGVNNLLQGKPDQAASDVGRVLVNSTVGIFGLFDVATGMGLKHHNEDFGQTLGRWGAEPGPYLVLPVFGPRDVRDGFGLVADIYGNPIGYMHDVGWRNSLWGASFVDTRANLNDAASLLDQAALDRYTFVRESYLQRRRNLVYDGDPPPLPPTPDDDAAPGAKDKASLRLPSAADTNETLTGGTPELAESPQPAISAATPSPAAEATAAEVAVKPQSRRAVNPVEVPATPEVAADPQSDRGAVAQVRP